MKSNHSTPGVCGLTHLMFSSYDIRHLPLELLHSSRWYAAPVSALLAC